MNLRGTTLFVIGSQDAGTVAEKVKALGMAVAAISWDDLSRIDPKKPSIVVGVIRSVDDIRKLQSLSVSNHHHKVVLVVDAKASVDSNLASAITGFIDKDAVWSAHDWVALLPFQLQILEKSWQREAQWENELTELVKRVEQDVELAAQVQKAMLPKKAPHIAGAEVTVRYLPASGPGGDYYDIFDFPDGKTFGLIMADSNTHGMAASLLSVLIKVRLDELKNTFAAPDDFVSFVNSEIRKVHKKEIGEISFLFAIFDRSQLTLEWASAGRLSPLVSRAGESILLSEIAEPFLGKDEKSKFSNHKLQLEPGDDLVFATDGWEHITQGNARAKFQAILEQHAKSGKHSETLEAELMGLVSQFQMKLPLKDDLTLIRMHIEERALYLASSKTKKG